MPDTTTMNTNSKRDPSNLNSSSNLNHEHGGGGVAGNGEMEQHAAHAACQSGDQSTMSMTTSNNMEYLKTLANAMSSHGGQGGDHGTSNSKSNNSMLQLGNSTNNASTMGTSNNNNDFLRMQNNNSDTDTCASSQYNARRVSNISKDSLVSRESISDMLNADQVASTNLDLMMNMMAQNQSQQSSHPMGGNPNQNVNYNFQNNHGAAAPPQNQSMSQLMMNGSMNMNSMSQLNSSSMMNNNSMAGAGGGNWNTKNNAAAATTNPMNMTDPSLLNNDQGSMEQGSTPAPLVIPPKKTMNKHKQTFAQKLMHILSLRECHDAIRWMPNGCAFCIVDPKELLDSVLPKYFKEAKYTSFTRKLNRWGFKHFTLPTSTEPSAEKEMSIYTHEKFLRDNPALCQQMDGGHRSRNSHKETQDDDDVVLVVGGSSQAGASGSGAGHHQDTNMQQFQQQTLMMQQQMQQLHQQNMMMQQLQQQQQQHHQMGQNQASQAPMYDTSTLNNMAGGTTGGGAGTNYNSMMSSYNNNHNPSHNSLSMVNQSNNTMNLMDSSIATGGNAMGMRRTSLGFMPYNPASSTRRDSGFSIGGLGGMAGAGSHQSLGIGLGGMAGGSSHQALVGNLGGMAGGGSSHQPLVGGLGGMAGGGSSHQSLEKFRKMSPNLHTGGANTSNAIFDAYKMSSSNNSNNTHGLSSQGGGGGEVGNKGRYDGDIGNNNQEHLRHSQTKLAVLEDMIAKERREQSLLSGMGQGSVDL